MGNGESSLEPELQQHLPETKERFIGLENLGLTCFVNSVLQVLFRVEPLKSAVIQWAMCSRAGETPALSRKTLLMEEVAALFADMEHNSYRTGTLEPRRVVQATRRLHDFFAERQEQHDAQEFYSWLVNELAETVAALPPGPGPGLAVLRRRYEETKGLTFVHAALEGLQESITRCCACGTESRRAEPFFELATSVVDGSSVAFGLRQLWRAEPLAGFHCEAASCVEAPRDAVRRSALLRLPRVLVVHLKRFQYDARSQRLRKLLHRVSFCMELRLPAAPDTLFRLLGVVVHVGASVASGHYVSIVRVQERWFLFNDEHVQIISSMQLSNFFGGSMSAYMLFYEKVE